MGGFRRLRPPFTHLLCQELLAKPKVGEDNMALGVQKHILQLQISVDDAQLAGGKRALRVPPPTPPPPLLQLLFCTRALGQGLSSGVGGRMSLGHWTGEAI